ncbi:ArsA family ATPase [Marinobacter gelidimuriae]|uniref:ArsA family ATPase n=1 Tax=Marinobacter gelidimuriae TaxID=2739064 RepID=UPI0003A2CC7D|nr:ArsA family ATPase [Marinobacter gelidimuriae]
MRLLLFGGKGGVGKTTCAAAAALHLAAKHPARSYLLVSTDPAHSLRDCLAGGALGQNLTLREIDPQGSLARFRARHHHHLRTIALRGTFFDEADIAQLLDLSMPGLDEMMALLEIVAWVKEERYACIVVDTAPAGHTLRLLELPELMRKWLVVLDSMLAKHRFMVKLFSKRYAKDAADIYLQEMASDLRYLWTLLQSSTQCRFVPVLLAERLSVHVTRRMLEELASLQIPVRELVVNRLLHSQPDCPLCSARVATQTALIADIQRTFPGHAPWGLPLFLEETRGTERLTSLWAQLRPLDAWQPLSPAPAPALAFGSFAAVENPACLPSSSMRLLLFAGKGGVGKTTLACASALRLAEEWQGKEILLVSIDPAHSLSACLNRQIGPEEVRLSRGLSAIELDPEAEYARLKQLYADEVAGVFERLSAQAHIHVEFDQEVIERLMDTAPPGLDEMLAITRVVELLDQGRYDLVILDTAPTGHLLRFLEMPELIEAWLKTFFGIFLKYRQVFRLPHITQAMVELSKKVKQFRRVLTDPERAALMAVTIPTEMAYEETRDLVAACERLRVAVPVLFANMLTPESSCLTCSALRSGELLLLEQYQETFREQNLTIVYRQESVERERLGSLGRSLYDGLNPSPHDQQHVEHY